MQGTRDNLMKMQSSVPQVLYTSGKSHGRGCGILHLDSVWPLCAEE